MPSSATPANQHGPVHDHLDALHELLLFVASGGFPSRQIAVDYIGARSPLLASPIGQMLPGFLYQCGTIDRFKDFIFLYDPDPDLRREFIDRMIGRARVLSGPDSSEEPPPRAPTQPQPPIWKF